MFLISECSVREGVLANHKHHQVFQPPLCHHPSPPSLVSHDADLDDKDLLKIGVKMLKQTITISYHFNVEEGDTDLHSLRDPEDLLSRETVEKDLSPVGLQKC